MSDNNDAFFGAAMGAMCGSSKNSSSGGSRSGDGFIALVGIALIIGVFVAAVYLLKIFVFDIPMAIYRSDTRRSLIACIVFGVLLLIISIIAFCFAGIGVGSFVFIPIFLLLQMLGGIYGKNGKKE